MLVLPLAVSWAFAVLLSVLDGRRRPAVVASLAGLGAAFTANVWLAAAVLTGGPREMVTGGWPAGVGIVLRADALGVSFTVLTSGLLFVILFYEASRGIEGRIFPALVLFLAAGLNGLFLTADAFNFYVFFEISMTASFVLTAYGNERVEIRNALIFTVVNLVGSVLFLGGIAGLYRLSGTLYLRDIPDALRETGPAPTLLIAAVVFSAFSVKLGLFPFHFWLPAAYRDARPAVAAILSGVLANIGSYGLIRFGSTIFDPQLRAAAPVLVALGSASILYGAVVALSRRRAGEVLAYSSISQAGYILIALAIAHPLGYAAAVVYAVVNSINKALLFLAAGLRGALVGGSFAAGALSVSGVPPAGGFFAKAAVFRAAILELNGWVLGVLVVGGMLSLAYMFRIYQIRFWQPRQETETSSPGSRYLVLALAGLLLALGLWPAPLLETAAEAGRLLEAGR